MIETDVRSCPFCGGEIKAAAKICKHCRQPVPDITESPQVRLSKQDQRIRDLVVEKGLVAAEQLDQVLAKRGQAAGDLLSFLASQGLITAAQVNSIRSSLNVQIMGEARRLGVLAVEKMLITQEQFDEIITEMGQANEPPNLPDFLVHKGLITTAQASMLDAPVAPRKGGPHPTSGAVGAWSKPDKPLNFKLPLILYSIYLGAFTLAGFVEELGRPLFGLYGNDRDIVVRLFLIGAFVCGVLSVVFSAILHFNCWSVIPPSKAPFSPGRAVGFLFIPFFNFYWVFESIPKLANCLNEVAGSSAPKRANWALALTLAILFVLFMLIYLFAATEAVTEEDFTFMGLVAIAYFVIWILFYRDATAVAEYIRTRR